VVFFLTPPRIMGYVFINDHPGQFWGSVLSRRVHLKVRCDMHIRSRYSI
jgi:hypothetical protein